MRRNQQHRNQQGESMQFDLMDVRKSIGMLKPPPAGEVNLEDRINNLISKVDQIVPSPHDSVQYIPSGIINVDQGIVGRPADNNKTINTYSIQNNLEGVQISDSQHQDNVDASQLIQLQDAVAFIQAQLEKVQGQYSSQALQITKLQQQLDEKDNEIILLKEQLFRLSNSFAQFSASGKDPDAEQMFSKITEYLEKQNDKLQLLESKLENISLKQQISDSARLEAQKLAPFAQACHSQTQIEHSNDASIPQQQNSAQISAKAELKQNENTQGTAQTSPSENTDMQQQSVQITQKSPTNQSSNLQNLKQQAIQLLQELPNSTSPVPDQNSNQSINFTQDELNIIGQIQQQTPDRNMRYPQNVNNEVQITNSQLINSTQSKWNKQQDNIQPQKLDGSGYIHTPTIKRDRPDCQLINSAKIQNSTLHSKYSSQNPDFVFDVNVKDESGNHEQMAQKSQKFLQRSRNRAQSAKNDNNIKQLMESQLQNQQKIIQQLTKQRKQHEIDALREKQNQSHLSFLEELNEKPLYYPKITFDNSVLIKQILNNCVLKGDANKMRRMEAISSIGTVQGHYLIILKDVDRKNFHSLVKIESDGTVQKISGPDGMPDELRQNLLNHLFKYNTTNKQLNEIQANQVNQMVVAATLALKKKKSQ